MIHYFNNCIPVPAVVTFFDHTVIENSDSTVMNFCVNDDSIEFVVEAVEDIKWVIKVNDEIVYASAPSALFISEMLNAHAQAFDEMDAASDFMIAIDPEFEDNEAIIEMRDATEEDILSSAIHALFFEEISLNADQRDALRLVDLVLSTRR